MIPHKFGVYWAPSHGQNEVLDFIRDIQPPTVLVLTEDVQPISDVFEAAPNALIIPRVWAIDDFHGQAVREILENPNQAARSHFERAYRMWRMWQQQAFERSLPWPDLNQVLFPCANEINNGVDYPTANHYFKAYCHVAETYDARAVVGRLGVGHPFTLYTDGTVDWSDTTEGLEHVINAGDHVWSDHVYWQQEGPFHEEDYPFLAGRWESNPMQVPMINEESGVDAGIYDRFPKQGWKGQDVNLTPEEYVDQVKGVHRRVEADDRMLSMKLFSADFQNKEDWATFDIRELFDRFRAWLYDRTESPPIVPPVVVVPPPTVDSMQPIDPYLTLAIFNIESGKRAHSPDGRPIVRFEALQFRKELDDHELFDEYFQIAATRAWEKPQYYRDGDRWVSIHTGEQQSEYEALKRAVMLDSEKAYRSTSMGVAQIMGFNHKRLGYDSAAEMYYDFERSEVMQVIGFLNFLLTDPDLYQAMLDYDFETIALKYNGSSKYAPLLEAEYYRIVDLDDGARPHQILLPAVEA